MNILFYIRKNIKYVKIKLFFKKNLGFKIRTLVIIVNEIIV